MKTMTFEKLSGPIYPAYLHLGDYSIALEPELIQSLKAFSGKASPLFLEDLLEAVGQNRYLKEMIEAAIAKAGDPDALVTRLKKDLAAL